MLDYNVPHGKLNRGMAVVDVLVAMNKGADLSEEQKFKAAVLGWCIEFVRCLLYLFEYIQCINIPIIHDLLCDNIPIICIPLILFSFSSLQLQAYFLVADDMMDNSITRRGQPCWYRVPYVGLVAINDGIILEACIYRLLKKHFGGSPMYVHLLDLFHDTTSQTAHGQLLDTTTAPIGTVSLESSCYVLSLSAETLQNINSNNN